MASDPTNLEWNLSWINFIEIFDLCDVSFEWTTPFVLEDKFEQDLKELWEWTKKQDTHAYDGELVFVKSMRRERNTLSLKFGTIKFSEIILVNQFHNYFGNKFQMNMGILGVVCIITTSNNSHVLTGRRSRKGAWHYNRWAMPGGLIETNTLNNGFHSAIMGEIREEVLEVLPLTEPKIIAVSTGRKLLYFNFYVHIQVDDSIDLTKRIRSNYEFINQELEWKKVDNIVQTKDEELFGGCKFVKYCWKYYLDLDK